jgi:hypothetical protein
MVRSLTAYWNEFPPTHEILRSLLRGMGAKMSGDSKREGQRLIAELMTVGGGQRVKRNKK